jgi:hypothetical protein
MVHLQEGSLMPTYNYYQAEEGGGYGGKQQGYQVPWGLFRPLRTAVE